MKKEYVRVVEDKTIGRVPTLLECVSWTLDTGEREGARVKISVSYPRPPRKKKAKKP